MKTNLQELMNRLKVNAAQFAEEIGIQRSSISHFLSGRNNPSLDVIRKILVAYPQIDAHWLISGEGEMMKSTISISTIEDNEPEAVRQDLFSTIREEEQASYALNKQSHSSKAPSVSLTDGSTATEKQLTVKSEVERIVIFYRNGSFKEYMPQ